METKALLNIKQQVEAKTGLNIREQDLGRFREVVTARIKQHRLARPADYQRLLRDHAAASDPEWQKLAALITIGESYFFRDKGQFAVLREQILPELISARAPYRTLKLWSAGCASGEEPYSLAILLGELLPHQQDWQIRILGTDINDEAIGKARRGIYSAWSFRMGPDELKTHYFNQLKDTWQISERIRNLVEFQAGNLLDLSDQLTAQLQDVDLIICRNVFIYLNKEAISQVLERFGRLLRQSGYLMTGHGELHGHGLVLKTLRPRVWEGSVIYQKIDPGACLPGPLMPKGVRQPQAAPKSAPPSPKTRRKPQTALPHHPGARTAQQPFSSAATPPPETPAPLEDLFIRGDYPAAITLGETLLKQDPKNFEVLHLLAQTYANRGQPDHAARLCRQMLELNPRAVQPYFMLAHLAEAQEDYEAAKQLFKKVVYLDHSFVPAYLELSGLYARERDRKRADTMRRTALELLRGMAPDQLLEPYREVTVGELIKLLK